MVGAFVTFNTISITVAQRIREFATLRSLGRLAAAGAALGPGRGLLHRRARLGRRALRRPRAGQGPERALRRARPLAADDEPGARNPHRRRLAGARDRGDDGLQPGARPARDPDPAGGGDARGRDAAAEPRLAPPRADRRRRRGSGDRPARLRLLRRPRHAALDRADRRRLHRDVLRRRARRGRRGPASRRRRRGPGAPVRRRGRPPRRRERDPQPDPHRSHRGGADGRPGAGHGRRHARRRASLLRPRSARERRRLRLRGHLQERLRTLPGGGGRGAAGDEWRQPGLQRPQRQGEGLRRRNDRQRGGRELRTGLQFQLEPGVRRRPRRARPRRRGARRGLCRRPRAAGRQPLRDPHAIRRARASARRRHPGAERSAEDRPARRQGADLQPRLRRLLPAAVQHLHLRRHRAAARAPPAKRRWKRRSSRSPTRSSIPRPAGSTSGSAASTSCSTCSTCCWRSR